ncbi:MAG: biopolymer transporter ExbD [Verrucomicrobia bacterium]|nr:biopolymer transporter ExbD [Verrucomicrobiota bacterium]
MKFYSKPKRAPTTIIVALIDILVVLLIFFMVTTSFIRQPAVQITLPKSKTGKEVQREQGLVLTLAPDGKMFLNAEPITAAALPERLRNAKAKNPDTVLELRADQKTTLDHVIAVVDAANEAGIQVINTFTRSAKAAGGR